MPTISQLTATYSLTDTDQVPVYSTDNGDARKASLSTLKAYLISTTATGVLSVTATAPIVSSGGDNPNISISAASGLTDGYLAAADWNTFNSKGNGTVTSVAALTLGTTGTDVSSTVATGTTTPVITLNLPTASAVNRGLLSSTDYTTFDAKQSALVSGTNIKTVGGVSLLGAGDVGTLGASYGGTGLTDPGANGNVLTSNGTAWTSSAPAAGVSLATVFAIAAAL